MSKLAQCMVVAAFLWSAGDARAADEEGPPVARAEEARKALTSMNEALNYVKNKAKTAQDGRDVAKLNCVSEKSAQIQALIGVAQNFSEDLTAFMAAGETEAAD